MNERTYNCILRVLPLILALIYFLAEPPPQKDGYAVIVWLHSGDFMSGNSTEFNPFQIVFKQKVVIVNVAFRLGFFGFFTSADGESPGNYGLMDQSAALDWISKNIQLFNGDPKSITLMGHGAGAVSALLHLTSGDWSSDKFQKLIVMSGTPMDSNFVHEPKYFKPAVKEVAKEFGCEQITSKILQCLRRLPDFHIMANIPMFDWTPVIDLNLSNSTMPFIPENPKELFEKQSYTRKIPIMIGFTDMEQILDITMREMLENGLSNEMYVAFTTESVLKDIEELGMNNETTCSDSGSTGPNNQPIIDAMTFAYMPYFTSDLTQIRKKFIDFNTEKLYIAPSFSIAKALSKNSDVYMYRFDTKPKTQTITDMLPSWSGVPHRLDQIFVWGMPYWVSLENQTQWSAEDKRLSDIIMTMWANFAKYSNPTERGVYIRWDKFTDAAPGVLIIDRSFNMSDTTTLNYQGVHFWNDYYNRVFEQVMACCNQTSTGHSHQTTNTFIYSILFFILNVLSIGTISNGFK